MTSSSLSVSRTTSAGLSLEHKIPTPAFICICIYISKLEATAVATDCSSLKRALRSFLLVVESALLFLPTCPLDWPVSEKAFDSAFIVAVKLWCLPPVLGYSRTPAPKVSNIHVRQFGGFSASRRI